MHHTTLDESATSLLSEVLFYLCSLNIYHNFAQAAYIGAIYNMRRTWQTHLYCHTVKEFSPAKNNGESPKLHVTNCRSHPETDTAMCN